MMCCPFTQAVTAQHNGLHTAHSYALLDIDEDGDGERWVKVRNPWGREEWNGRQHPEYDDGYDDGTFWIDLQSFHTWVAECTVCYTGEEYQIGRCAGKWYPGDNIG